MNTSESSELVIHCIHSGRIPTVKGGWMATILNPYRSYRIKHSNSIIFNRCSSGEISERPEMGAMRFPLRWRI